MTLEETVRAASVDNRLLCSEAFKMAAGLDISRRQVGDMANRLKVRIIDCQLGCFQFAKATHDDLDTITIDSQLVDEVAASLVNSRLPCAAAFKIAAKLRVAPKDVGDAATKQKVKIVGCQLGCF